MGHAVVDLEILLESMVAGYFAALPGRREIEATGAALVVLHTGLLVVQLQHFGPGGCLTLQSQRCRQLRIEPRFHHLQDREGLWEFRVAEENP